MATESKKLQTEFDQDGDLIDFAGPFTANGERNALLNDARIAHDMLPAMRKLYDALNNETRDKFSPDALEALEEARPFLEA